MRDEKYSVIRCAVRTMYDLQKLRIQCGNRITAAFRYKLGLHSSDSEDSNAEAQEMLQDLRAEFSRITDGVKRITRHIEFESPLISNYGELCLIESYERQLEAERNHEKTINYELDKEPLYTEYLKDIRGVGTLMSGVILSEIDIRKCNSISALWAYSGLDTVLVTDKKTGEQRVEGRSRREGHLVPRTYTNKKGEVKETQGITFNPLLKTKMVGVLGDIFIKMNPDYKKIYDDYKHRLANHPTWKDRSKLHRHNAATRYMIKMFLADLWTEWRKLEGLEVKGSYQEEVLGHRHHTKAA